MSGTQLKLFLMMVLEIAVWGAWYPQIFGYLPALGFDSFQQSMILNAFPIGAILAMFIPRATATASTARTGHS